MLGSVASRSGTAHAMVYKRSTQEVYLFGIRDGCGTRDAHLYWADDSVIRRRFLCRKTKQGVRALLSFLLSVLRRGASRRAV
jgi:hypothetical protein